MQNMISKKNPPTYHRQRLLLFLLEQAGGALSALDLQKLLFLYTRESGKGYFAFVPYDFACHSFLAAHDLDLLHKQGWLQEEQQELTLPFSLTTLPWVQQSVERQNVRIWLKKNPEIIRKALENNISSATMNTCLATQKILPYSTETENILFTIGYEGLHFEEYVNHLLQHKVRLLCDLRHKPLSRKFGFSKGNLESILPKLGIAYQHLPELGIAAQSRQHLKTQADYEELFTQYRQSLPQRSKSLNRILEFLGRYQRIAITCFEREPSHCHRHCVSDFLRQEHGVTGCHL